MRSRLFSRLFLSESSDSTERESKCKSEPLEELEGPSKWFMCLSTPDAPIVCRFLSCIPIITAIAMAMAGSSSVVEAVLHVLVVPGLIVATSAAAATTVVVIVPVVGVVQMGVVWREWHPGPVPGGRPARVRPP